MVDDLILKQVIKGLGNIGEETGKEAVKQVAEIGHSIISGKELLGDIKPLTDEEIHKKKLEDQKKAEAEMREIRRNVEGEIGQVRQMIETEEEQKEKEEERERREKEYYAQMQSIEPLEMVSSNPAKQKKQRGSALAHKKKSSQPDPSQMSQTSEFKGKID